MAKVVTGGEARTKAAEAGLPSDRLVAVDAADGMLLSRAVTVLSEALGSVTHPCSVSRWDASGLFGDIVAAPAAPGDLSPRTLVLLFAADLAFRVRWEIAPAIEAGRVVVAAPYVATLIAFGRSVGAPEDWVRRMVDFAPAAAQSYVLKERVRDQPWKRRPERGFGEYCATLLDARPQGFARRKTRAAMIEALRAEAKPQGPRVSLGELAGHARAWSRARGRAAVSRKHKR